MSRSAIFARAVDEYHACRAEYALHLEAAFERAQDETGGALLNRRGQRAGVSAYSLFSGSEIRALAYASEELIEHWARYPRITYEQFERQWSPSAWS